MDVHQNPTNMAASRQCVVALDGSDDSDYALQWYCKQIHREGDKAVIVYVPSHFSQASRWENAVYTLSWDLVETTSEAEHEHIKAELLKFADKLLHLGIEGKVRSVNASRPEIGILRVAEEEHAEMILVGNRGKGAIHRALMGSVSEYLVNHAPCPVIVCRRPSKAAMDMGAHESRH